VIAARSSQSAHAHQATPSHCPLVRCLPIPIPQLLGLPSVATALCPAHFRAIATRSKTPAASSFSSRLEKLDGIKIEFITSVLEAGSRRSHLSLQRVEPHRGRFDVCDAGGKWHKLERIDGVSFYEGVDIVDADDPERIYSFRLSDPPHAACFRMSDSDHGNNIRISYSNCLSFYELPDGTKWAEHGYFYDKDDLTDHVQHENRRLPVARCA
jgi:hypothetical protein